MPFFQDDDTDLPPGWERAKAAPYDQPRTMVAAAMPLKLDGKASERVDKRKPSKWQVQAWRMFDAIGELHYSFGMMGSVVSRVRFFPALVVDASEPPTNIDGAVVGPSSSVVDGRAVVWDGTSGRLVKTASAAPVLFCEVHPQGYVAPETQSRPEAPTKLYANMRWTPGVRATFRVTYDPTAGRMQAWALAPWETSTQTPDGRWWTLCGTAEGEDLVVASPTDGGIEWDLLGGFDTGRSCGGAGGTKVERVVVRDLAWGTPIAWLDVAGLTVGDETYTDPTDDVAWEVTFEGGAPVAWVPFAPGV